MNTIEPMPDNVPTPNHSRLWDMPGVRTAAGIVMAGLALAGCANDCGTTPETGVVRDPSAVVDFVAGDAPISGVSKTAAGTLKVQPTGLAIHSYRDGADGANNQYQPNPPLIWNKHVETAGDFQVDSQIKLDPNAVFTLTIDGKTPTIYDDFRVDQGVDLTIANNALLYRVDDGHHTYTHPAATQLLGLSDTSPTKNIALKRTGNQLAVTVNGQNVPIPNAPDVFNTSQVWLGMASNRSASEVTKLSVSGNGLQSVDSSQFTICECPGGLADLSRKLGGPDVGEATSLYELYGNNRYASLAVGNSTITTPANALKLQNREPEPGKFTFAEADAFVDTMLRNGVKVHGHSLVDHHAQPSWAANALTNTPEQRAHVKQLLLNDVSTTAAHFKGRVSSWDVFNEAEAFNQPGQTWRDTVWLRAYEGNVDQLFADVFNAVHAAAPDATLYFNDFALDKLAVGLGGDQLRFTTYLNEAIKLRQQGVPIAGIGSQGHVFERPRDDSNVADCIVSNGTLVFSGLGCRMNMAADAGLEFNISEFDISPNVKQADGSFKEDRTAQANLGEAVATACITHPNACRFIITWGIGGAEASTVAVAEDGTVTPHSNLMFNENLAAVPFYTSMQKAFTPAPQS